MGPVEYNLQQFEAKYRRHEQRTQKRSTESVSPNVQEECARQSTTHATLETVIYADE